MPGIHKSGNRRGIHGGVGYGKFWEFFDGEGSQIFYYDGTTVTMLTVSWWWTARSPQINDSGQVVWDMWQLYDDSYAIVSYDGTAHYLMQSPTFGDGYVSGPQINNSGHAVWEGSVNCDPMIGPEDPEIFYYDGTTVARLTNNSINDTSPQINDSGQVVWEGSDGSDTEIFYYNGTTVTQLTNNAYNDTNPQINNSGHAVWEGSDGSDSEIFYYDGTTVTKLTNNSYNDQNPQINDIGQVVWEGSDGSDTEIFMITIVNTCTENWQCLEGSGCVEGACVVDTPPVITAGPFLAAGWWPVLPRSEATAFVLDQNYTVLWSFTDDYATCDGVCSHRARYQKIGDTTWKYLAPQTDGTGKRYAFVELPVDRMTDGSYKFVFDLFDCAGQLKTSKTYYFNVQREQ